MAKRNKTFGYSIVGRFKVSLILNLILFFGFWINTSSALAWGTKGHYVICEAAIHLVKNPDLKSYLLHKTQNMGHLCNVPDIYWRQLPNTESGNSTHFIEPDLVGSSLEESPLIFSNFVTLFEGKTNIIKKNKISSAEKEIGTLWWRADQFVKLAIASGRIAKSLELPDVQNEKNDDHPYNKAIYIMLTQMGLLGHFVGDAAQPLHSTYNYDGWENGHGGIHSYYEESIVVHLDTKLLDTVVKNAPKLIKQLDLSAQSTPVEKMQKLTIIAHNDLALLWKLDPIKVKSELSTEKGLSIKKNATREDPAKFAKKLEPLIIRQMSLAALLLANFWDEIYSEVKMPNLNVCKGYRFPLQPEFVEPNYTPTTTTKSTDL